LGVVAILHVPYIMIYALHLLGPVSSHYLEYALVYLGIAFGYWGIGLGLASLYGHQARPRLIADLHRDG
jgi:hypothetical protein